MQTQEAVKTPEARPQEAPVAKMKVQRVVPAIDVYENSDEFVLIADVPGLSDENLDLALENSVLTLVGTAVVGTTGMEYHRAIAVPETVDASAIDAALDRGVLKVRLPKRADLKPRRITVRTN